MQQCIIQITDGAGTSWVESTFRDSNDAINVETETGERLKTAVGPVSCLLSGEFPFRNWCIQGDATSFFLHSNWANDFEIFQEFLNANVLEILFFLGFFVFSNSCDNVTHKHTLRTQMCGSSAQLGMTQCCIIREAETPGPGWLFRILGRVES